MWVFPGLQCGVEFPRKGPQDTRIEIHELIHMSNKIILASGSEIRATLLRNAGLEFDIAVARVDEDMLRRALEAEGAPPRDVADALAEAKAGKVAMKNPDRLVIGCDQVLEFEGRVFSKPTDIDEARRQLMSLRGNRHQLLSALVVFHENQPVWRHVGVVRLQMRDFSNAYLDEYLDRNWDSIRWSVGGYKLEEEGVRLFHRVDGDYFNVLGLPLIELLNYLTTRGDLKT
ncbi:septum formation protein [Shimia gijangensis]|uniref:Nucleoside triphosphate pyrophosphatase n=2 Tax=Shimia gijangensis TaxID=1470563 RepID=A0A1M6MS32_9RHOB|nr:septum formation protein [Shimia gijangensis]